MRLVTRLLVAGAIALMALLPTPAGADPMAPSCGVGIPQADIGYSHFLFVDWVRAYGRGVIWCDSDANTLLIAIAVELSPGPGGDADANPCQFTFTCEDDVDAKGPDHALDCAFFVAAGGGVAVTVEAGAERTVCTD